MRSSLLPTHRRAVRHDGFAILLLSISATLLSGCALKETAGTLPVEVAAGIHGKAMGGQQPVSGATVALFVIGSSGYGITGVLLSSTTTDAGGNFTLPGYTCPTAASPTLLYAGNGNPGLAGGTNNTAILMAAVTGPCGQLKASDFVQVNELTTVATAYTLRPFEKANAFGTSSTNVLGLTNAMLTYKNLMNNVSGRAPGANVPAGVSIPVAEMNTLANVLAACVNTAGPSSVPCVTLFGLTGVASPAPVNVFSAAVAIASSPGANVAGIFGIATSSSPFQPALTVAPTDFTLPISYMGGYLGKQHMGMDIDSIGNVWVAVRGGVSGTGSMEELSPGGVLLQSGLGDGLINGPSGLAIDAADQVLVSSNAVGHASVLRYSANGTLNVTYTGNMTVPDAKFGTSQTPPLVSPTAVFSSDDRTFLFLEPGSHSEVFFCPGYVIGESFCPSAFALGGTSGKGVYIAEYGTFNQQPVFWVTNEDVAVVDSSYSGNPHVASNGLGGHVAPDSKGNAYHTLSNTNFVEVINHVSHTAQGSFVTFSHIGASGIRVDGDGNVWVGFLSQGDPTRTTRAAVYKPATASYADFSPFSSNPVPEIGIDGSGNVWLANGDSSGASTGLVELVGAAGPLTTSIGNAIASDAIGKRP